MKHEQEAERLKNEIQSLREDRNKLRSVTSSSASVTIYPPSTPSSDGIQSKEASVSGSPDTASQRHEEVKSSVDSDTSAKDEKTAVARDNVEEEKEKGGPDTVTEVVATE